MIIERGPDPEWVVKLSGKTPPEVLRYLKEAEADSLLRDQINQSASETGRDQFVQIAAPYELYALTRLLRPSNIVEVGVSAGISSAYFLSALDRNGHGVLHSIDLPERQIGKTFSSRRNVEWALPPGMETGWAVPRRLRNRWKLRLGSSHDMLHDIAEELENIDFFLYDVPYTRAGAIADFTAADGSLKSGALVCVDNGLGIITWWAEMRGAVLVRRHDSGLRGFRIPRSR